MRQHDADAQPSHEHQEVWGLLPWYVNGTLESQERVSVEAHLATCSACQVELTHCQELASAVCAVSDEAWSPSPAHFARVLASLDTVAPQTQDHDWWARLRAWYHRCRETLHDTSVGVRWALAAQGALVLVLASTLVWQGLWTSDKLYRTLTDVSNQAPQGQAQLRVVFADDIREKDLRALLTSVQGTIVAGPSSLGVYTVQVPLAGNLPESVTPTLAVLRAHPQVRLAEPASAR